ncbi:MAG: N-acetylmuramic acid 6-phosphate etherase [Propionibacteriaceae bacterium]
MYSPEAPEGLGGNPTGGHSPQLDEMSVAEITAQMNELDASIPRVIRAALPAISAAIEAAEAGFAAGGRLVYVGAGTSGRLGVLDASECPPTFHTDPSRVVGLIAGGPEAVLQAVEGAEDDVEAGAAAVQGLAVGRLDTVVGLAASGSTPYVRGALIEARRRGAVTVSLSCHSPAELSAFADFPIEVPVGPEIVRGSTRLKAGTAQKEVLNMISTTLMVRIGRTYGNLMVEVAATNDKLKSRAIDLVRTIAEVDQATAASALESADQEVKTATVMLVQQLAAAPARARLASVGGRLGAAIGIPSSQHPQLN